MATALDDVFNVSMTKKKKLLDLSKVKIQTYEDYLKYMDRVPEFKTVPEKVDISTLENTLQDFSFAPTKKERNDLNLQTVNLGESLGDPIPLSMQEVRMADLLSVDIHWKMLTDFRPINQKEEDYFNRLVDMGKFAKTTKKHDAMVDAALMSKIPGGTKAAQAFVMGFVTSKSKRGTLETKLKTCGYCGLELCSGSLCRTGHYDLYTRLIMDKEELEAEEKGFSLKAVIAQANQKPDAKLEEKRAKEWRKAKKGPSLKAMIYHANTTKGKKSSKKKKRKHAKGEDQGD